METAMHWKKALAENVFAQDIKFDYSLNELSTMRVGGPAEALVTVDKEESLCELLRFAHNNTIPMTIWGNGSNIIVRDGGIKGIVARIILDNIHIQNNSLRAQAGCRLSAIVRNAVEQNLSGLEFAQGIPASVGGAVVMNAGAYGGCIADYLYQVKYINENFELRNRIIQKKDFGYRSSIFAQKKWIVVEADFLLKKGNSAEIKALFYDYQKRRQTKQPLEFASAGSIFKRPEGYFAGQLIEEAGLKGYNIGDAQIAEKHAGFIINRGKATATDVLKLIDYVQKKVFENSGVHLETEVKVLGYD